MALSGKTPKPYQIPTTLSGGLMPLTNHGDWRSHLHTRQQRSVDFLSTVWRQMDRKCSLSDPKVGRGALRHNLTLEGTVPLPLYQPKILLYSDGGYRYHDVLGFEGNLYLRDTVSWWEHTIHTTEKVDLFTDKPANVWSPSGRVQFYQPMHLSNAKAFSWWNREQTAWPQPLTGQWTSIPLLKKMLRISDTFTDYETNNRSAVIRTHKHFRGPCPQCLL